MFRTGQFLRGPAARSPGQDPYGRRDGPGRRVAEGRSNSLLTAPRRPLPRCETYPTIRLLTLRELDRTRSPPTPTKAAEGIRR